jgi:hypothetical protein
MASSTRRICFSITAVAALWVSAFLGQCEATTVSLTAGPYSNSRRQSFRSTGWSRNRSQLSASLFDDDLDNESYKKVEECSVGLITTLTDKKFHSMFCDYTLLSIAMASPSEHIFFVRVLTPDCFTY